MLQGKGKRNMRNDTSIPSIVKMLEIARKGRTLRQLAEALGYPASFAGTLSDILRPAPPGHVSRETFRGLSVRLGMPPLPETEPTAVCPSCLALGKREVHAAGDCHGLPVASVACLAPDQEVARKGKARSRKHYRRPCFDDDPAVCLDQLEIYRGYVEAELIRLRNS